ncbi:MAG: tetratricopeptide repeat protein [Acidobacteriota bacterium]|nr:tetratricopeptide repeat protein [Blastocatellia bacterium]MDW8413797.1 tetratricopeptide repeat protein [Acidobacteriota bacterium]
MRKQDKLRVLLLLTCVYLSLWISSTRASAQQQELRAGRPSHSASTSVGSEVFSNSGAKTLLTAQLVQKIKQASALRGRWKLAESEALWREVLAIDEYNVDALLGLAEIERTRLNYQQALSLLNKADEAARDPYSRAQLLVAYGSLYLTLEEPEKAAEYFAEAHKLLPNYYGAILGKAGVAMLKRDYRLAESLLEYLLKQNASRVDAFIGLARIYLEENKNVLAAHYAQKALEIDRYNVDAMAALCAVRIAEKKPEAVRKIAKSVLELNPYNSGVRRLFSQYLNGRRGYQQRLIPEIQTLLSRAENLKRLGKYADAIEFYKQALSTEPKILRAWLGLAACQLAIEEFAEAAKSAERAIEIDPDSAIAHLQLSLAHSGLHEKARIEAGATDWRQLYLGQKEEYVPEIQGLAEVFVNYSSLTPEEQKVIRKSVLPLAKYLPELKRKGAKHFLLATDKKLSEITGYESLENRITFDGRYYASVRGVGGLVTVSGIEYLDVSMRGGFNTIAHEFAHQVHTSALSPEICSRIKKLYQNAIKTGKALDYYAASNEWEYFAQGYEAYVSEFKRPSAGVTARHNREELKKLDPDLFALFEELSSSQPKTSK